MLFCRRIDIHSKKRGIAKRLSNFTKRNFVFDGVECHSIEGFLQSLKFSEISEQEIVCRLYGGQAKQIGELRDWKKSGILYWQGKAYERDSEAYRELIARMYREVYRQDEQFRKDVMRASHYTVDHTIGKDDPRDTILTRVEFLTMLSDLVLEDRS